MISGLPAVLSGRGRWLLLGVVCLGLWLPGFCALPVFDRDEARFAQASRQMLESGDLVDIRFQDEARHKKPAGIYWLQAASVALLSTPEAAVIGPYRIPSLLGALAAVLATAWAGARLFGRGPAALGALMLAGTVLLGVEARMAKTDAVLLATVVLAQGVLARAWLDRAGLDRATPKRLSWPLVLGFWGALGVGVMVKGPIGAMVTVLTALALVAGSRQGRWLGRLRPLAGMAILLAIAAPWLVLITLRTGGTFFNEAVGHDLAAKMASGQEGKGLPPGFYLGTFWLTFAPFAGAVALGLRWAWRSRRDGAVQFCLAWIIPSWLVFEAVPTKLLHYTLPTFPALALLAAAAAAAGYQAVAEGGMAEGGMAEGGMAEGGMAAGSGAAARRDWVRGIFLGLGALVLLVLGLGIAALPWVVERAVTAAASPLPLSALPLSFLLPGLPAVAGAVLAARAGLDWGRRPPLMVCGTALVGAAILFFTAHQVMLPALDGLWLSRSAAALVAQHRPCPQTTVVSGGYTEPSLVFLLGTATRLGDGPTAAARLRQDPVCTLALVEAREAAAFTAALAGWPVRVLGQVAGFNYSRGKRQALTLHAASP